MRVHDEAVHADREQMVHRVRNDGPSSDRQERLWTSLRQRAEAHSQAGTQNESCLKPPFMRVRLQVYTFVACALSHSDVLIVRLRSPRLERPGYPAEGWVVLLESEVPYTALYVLVPLVGLSLVAPFQ